MSVFEYERTVGERALALAGPDCSPHYNIAPLMDLIRRADELGYAVANKPASDSVDD